MPFNSNEELPKGVKNLPPEQQTKWRKVFNAAYEGSTCKDAGERRDECASKVAWSQIDDKYKGKALVEFSLALTSVTHEKKSGNLRWKAVASDVDEDFYHDNMSLELFNDFISRIQISELAPEEFRSSFWQGGMPYLSISHYPDLEGKAVPGPVERVFIDGVQFKAEGQFNKSDLGLRCYYALCKDLYEEPKPEKPVRVSIAFLDYGHVHKSNNYEFIREKIDDVCPECREEFINGGGDGKIYKKGLLVHLALTRVPANERTSMEVDKSMSTRKEDAESIIGEDLTEEIEEEAKLIGKSQTMVIKSEETVVEEAKKPTEDEETPEEEDQEDEEEAPDGKKKKPTMKSETEEEPEIIVEEAVTKKEADCAHPSSHYLVVEDSSKPTTWHLRVKGCDGKPDHGLMAKARAALQSNFRGKSYQGPSKQAALSKLKGMYKREGMSWGEKKSIEDLEIELSWVQEELNNTVKINRDEIVEPQPITPATQVSGHELDATFDSFKQSYDEIKAMPISSDEKLQKLQDHFQTVGQDIVSHMKATDVVEPSAQQPAQNELVQALSLAIAEAMRPVQEQLSLILTQQKEMVKSPMEVATPVRRSIVPTRAMQAEINQQFAAPKRQSETPKLRAIIERNLRQSQ